MSTGRPHAVPAGPLARDRPVPGPVPIDPWAAASHPDRVGAAVGTACGPGVVVEASRRGPAVAVAAEAAAAAGHRPSRKARAATGAVTAARALPARPVMPGARRSRVVAARVPRRRIGAVAVGVWAPTATIGGGARSRRPQGSPLELLALRRISISDTSGENSIPTKKAVATQITSLMSLIPLASPAA